MRIFSFEHLFSFVLLQCFSTLCLCDSGVAITEMAKFVSVACREEDFVVTLDYNLKRNNQSMSTIMAEVLDTVSACVEIESDSCCTQPDYRNKYHTVTLSYKNNQCNVRSTSEYYGHNYTMTVLIRDGARRKEVPISCALPTRRRIVDRVEFDIAYQANEESEKFVNLPHTTEKVVVPANKLLEMNVIPVASVNKMLVTLPDIHAYPIYCYTKSEVDETRKVFLDDGCPVAALNNEEKLFFLSQLSQRDTAGPIASSTSILANTITEWLPYSRSMKNWKKSGRAFSDSFSIHCELAICAGPARHQHGVLGLTPCPSAAPCGDVPPRVVPGLTNHIMLNATYRPKVQLKLSGSTEPKHLYSALYIPGVFLAELRRNGEDNSSERQRVPEGVCVLIGFFVAVVVCVSIWRLNLAFGPTIKDWCASHRLDSVRMTGGIENRLASDHPNSDFFCRDAGHDSYTSIRDCQPLVRSPIMPRS